MEENRGRDTNFASAARDNSAGCDCKFGVSPRLSFISRRNWLLAGLALPLSRAFGSNPISVRYDGDNLRAAAPTVHFLTGKTLDRLKDANTVALGANLSLYAIDQPGPFRYSVGTFEISYDLWEETFKVIADVPSRRAKAGLTAVQTEEWCLENLAVSASGLAPDRLFFLRLEMRATDPKQFSGATADPGSFFRAMVDFISRKAGPGDPHWGPYQSGAFRLSDLRAPGRGARNG